MIRDRRIARFVSNRLMRGLEYKGNFTGPLGVRSRGQPGALSAPRHVLHRDPRALSPSFLPTRLSLTSPISPYYRAVILSPVDLRSCRRGLAPNRAFPTLWSSVKISPWIRNLSMKKIGNFFQNLIVGIFGTPASSGTEQLGVHFWFSIGGPEVNLLAITQGFRSGNESLGSHSDA